MEGAELRFAIAHKMRTDALLLLRILRGLSPVNKRVMENVGHVIIGNPMVRIPWGE